MKGAIFDMDDLLLDAEGLFDVVDPNRSLKKRASP